MDNLSTLLIGYGGLIGAIWAATEFLPRAIPPLRRLTKELLAILIGIAAGPVGYLVNLVPVPEVTGWKAYVAAAFIGLAGTILAGAGHDYLVKPVVGKGGTP